MRKQGAAVIVPPSLIFDHCVFCVKLVKYKTLDYVVKLDHDRDESIVRFDFLTPTPIWSLIIVLHLYM